MNGIFEKIFYIQHWIDSRRVILNFFQLFVVIFFFFVRSKSFNWIK